MLIGRHGARETVDALLHNARVGSSGMLVVQGEPGIGKSAPLDYARQTADDMRVLSTTGVTTEAALAFAGLLELLWPLRDLVADIPTPQAEALAGALALAPPAVGDRFTVSAGVLSLLFRAAEETPVLVCVDDAQWVDQPSLEAVLFAARRLGPERIAVVIAARDDSAVSCDLPGPHLRLEGIQPADAVALLSARRRKTTLDVAGRLVAETGGNPLAIIEISGLLSAEQLYGTRFLPDPLPASTAEQALARRVDGMDAAVQRALLVVAAAGSEVAPVLNRALMSQDLSPSLLNSAEGAELIDRKDGRVTFRHPLLRSAIYHAGTPAATRAAHLALAVAFEEKGDTARQAGHLAAAADGPSEPAAQLLLHVARQARDRAAYSSAAETFERGARLTADQAVAAERLVEAARAALLAGQPRRALSLLDDALAGAGEPLRAEVQYARANVQVATGDPVAAYRLLTNEAARYASSAPEMGARFLTAAAIACFPLGRIAHAVQAAQRAHQLATDPAIAQAAQSVLAHALVLSGDEALARQVVDGLTSKVVDGLFLQTPAASVPAWEQMYPLAQLCTWIEEYDKARAIASGVISAARSRSILAGLPYMLAVQSELDFRQGDWLSARVNGVEALELGEQTGQNAILPFCVVTLGRLDAAQGRADDARELAARALNTAEELGIDSIHAYAGSLLGLLELGAGDGDAAIANLEPVGSRMTSMGMRHPYVVPWAPDLIEAYVRTDRMGDAKELLDEFQRSAQRTGNSWARAAAARCAGLPSTGRASLAHFEQALRLHSAGATPFEEARTRLCLAETLLTTSDVSRARTELRNALAVFRQLGARPWGEAARRQLRLCGDQVAGPAETPIDRLTAQELKVALTVAQGATNKAAAESLFLSPKTVEFHLGNVYHKLGLSSRGQLTRYWHTEVVDSSPR